MAYTTEEIGNMIECTCPSPIDRDTYERAMLGLLYNISLSESTAPSNADATAGSVTPTRTEAVAAGSSTALIQSVRFVNIGSTNATVAGVSLLPGEEVSFAGYYDNVTNTYKRLAAIAYTASATAILHISEVP